ncbi:MULTISPECIES: FapA family protein [Clostridium]|uniref:DUF342 domain-containing protein n=1 Tax=Clostridium cibarium TaxID=2762247 RepID=A0ABR8PNW8_9CLOT|nr:MULTISPECIES: FapA family protein [Clostridium]MBD7909875.1 DUF342 domain-containing protein [Clostridium cibarium]
MDYNYSEKSLEECLKKAEKELSILRDKLDYEVIKEEKGFFKKKCIIKVHVDEENEEDVVNDTENFAVTNEKANNIIVKEDKILLDIEEGSTIEIEFENGIKLFVNGKEVSSPVEVAYNDELRYEGEKVNARRSLNIHLDNDRTMATVDIEYIPEEVKEAYCKIIGNKVKISGVIADGKMPPLYTKDEIKEALRSKGVIYGIIDEKINEISMKAIVKDEVVAKGLPVVHDEEDRIDIKFDNTKRNVDESSKEKIDYRNLYSMANVGINQVIAELVEGKVGHNGMNIFGVEIKKKSKKTLQIVAGDGCKLEDNKIISTMEGRPTVKSGVFYVNKMFETAKDVDMASGNITFVGDVKIAGSIKDGMKVEAGNSVEVGKNVEAAKIISQGEIHVKGSALGSEIIAGVKDLNLQSSISMLEEFKKDIELLVASLEEVKRRHIVSDDKPDGEIIKLLLETKFKDIPKKASELLKNTVLEGNWIDKIKRILREKIIGSGPLGIKYFGELYELIECIDKELKPLKMKISHPVDIYLNYSQDTKVKASGTIYITGKGQYVSELVAEGNIEFLSDGAIARGGVLSAGKEIKAKVVGSTAGVTTTLKVGKGGVITADIAYPNTVFVFGERKYTLETASKQIKAYLDEQGEVVVDKFVL